MPVVLAADEALWFHFRAHGRRWRVLLVLPDHDMLEDEDDGSPLFGCCDYDTRTIYIDASVTQTQLNDTTHHEMSHASAREGLPVKVRDTDLARDVEEVVIRCVSPVVCRVARLRWPAFPPEALALRRMARRKARS
jgi:hypothetical protein